MDSFSFIMGIVAMYFITMICFVIVEIRHLDENRFMTFFFLPFSLANTAWVWIEYLRKKKLAEKIVNLEKFKETNHSYCYTQVDYLTDCLSLAGLKDMYKKYTERGNEE